MSALLVKFKKSKNPAKAFSADELRKIGKEVKATFQGNDTKPMLVKLINAELTKDAAPKKAPAKKKPAAKKGSPKKTATPKAEPKEEKKELTPDEKAQEKQNILDARSLAEKRRDEAGERLGKSGAQLRVDAATQAEFDKKKVAEKDRIKLLDEQKNDPKHQWSPGSTPGASADPNASKEERERMERIPIEAGSPEDIANKEALAKKLGDAGIAASASSLNAPADLTEDELQVRSEERAKLEEGRIDKDAASIMSAVTSNMPPYKADVRTMIEGAFPHYGIKFLKPKKSDEKLAVEITSGTQTVRIPKKGYFDIRI